MTDILALLDETLTILDGAVAAASPTPHAATPCPDYDVRQVTSHLLWSVDALCAPADGGPGADATAIWQPVDVGGDLVAATRQRVDRAGKAWRGVADLSATMTSPIGSLPAHQQLAALIFHTLIHSWDLATAAGTTLIPPSDALLDLSERLGREMLPAAPTDWYASPYTGPADTRLDKLIAFCGRVPHAPRDHE